MDRHTGISDSRFLISLLLSGKVLLLEQDRILTLICLATNPFVFRFRPILHFLFLSSLNPLFACLRLFCYALIIVDELKRGLCVIWVLQNRTVVEIRYYFFSHSTERAPGSATWPTANSQTSKPLFSTRNGDYIDALLIGCTSYHSSFQYLVVLANTSAVLYIVLSIFYANFLKTTKAVESGAVLAKV